ncbi:MAG: hypothetical protein HRU17_23265 [Polyangiaceae bacterium]|nr:hypothetical protein [Polyangiaceae bacterium]
MTGGSILPLMTIALITLCSACTEPSPAESVMGIAVVTESGDSVTGAVVSAASVPPQTSTRAPMEFVLPGRLGDLIELRLSCPDDYEAPPQKLSFRLRSDKALGGAHRSRPAVHELICNPLRMSVVLAVRARDAGGVSMPGVRVVVNGEPAGETSEAGILHQEFVLDRHQRVTVELVTAEEGGSGEGVYGRVRPRNPTRQYRPEGDQVLVFAQEFDIPAPERRRPRPRTRRIPYQLR